jgi:transcriptional regulator with XRE-family HTH domain
MGDEEHPEPQALRTKRASRNGIRQPISRIELPPRHTALAHSRTPASNGSARESRKKGKRWAFAPRCIVLRYILFLLIFGPVPGGAPRSPQYSLPGTPFYYLTTHPNLILLDQYAAVFTNLQEGKQMADLSRVGEPPNLGDVFRRAREAAGLKQEDVIAVVPGVSQSTYSRFELGQANLDVTEIFKIKEFLDSKERTRASGRMSLWALTMGRPNPLSTASPSVRKGKLTEEIAKELADEYECKETKELDRQLDEELPELRVKVSNLTTENAKLKAQLAELTATLNEATKNERANLKALRQERAANKPRNRKRSKAK